MDTTIKRDDFALCRIDDMHCDNFKRRTWPSDIPSYVLEKIGNCFMGSEAQSFWTDGAFMWYTDKSQSDIESVWFTTNDILIYQTQNNMYRVIPK